jgi:hypothetical protein
LPLGGAALIDGFSAPPLPSKDPAAFLLMVFDWTYKSLH